MTTRRCRLPAVGKGPFSANWQNRESPDERSTTPRRPLHVLENVVSSRALSLRRIRHNIALLFHVGDSIMGGGGGVLQVGRPHEIAPPIPCSQADLYFCSPALPCVGLYSLFAVLLIDSQLLRLRTFIPVYKPSSCTVRNVAVDIFRACSTQLTFFYRYMIIVMCFLFLACPCVRPHSCACSKSARAVLDAGVVVCYG